MNPLKAEHYCVRLADETDGVITLEIAFGAPAQNDLIVRDAIAALARLELKGGKGIKLNGPASLPVAMALGHSVAHLYGFVACFDPKLGCYVVAISHDPEYKPGDLMP
jgi:CRISPR-associated protein Csx3